MIDTPFGPIKICIDNMPYFYQETACPNIANHYHVDACYRVHVPVSSSQVICCFLPPCHDSIVFSSSTGERYLVTEFESGGIQLAIGMLDEMIEFESFVIEHGCAYRILSEVSEVSFGIAWTLQSNNKCDSRAWLAADPSETE